MEMNRIPCASSGRSLRRSSVSGRSSLPNMVVCDGPYTSASRRPTRAPSAASATARLAETVLLPTPPFPEATATTFRTPSGLVGACAGPRGPGAALSATRGAAEAVTSVQTVTSACLTPSRASSALRASSRIRRAAALPTLGRLTAALTAGAQMRMSPTCPSATMPCPENSGLPTAPSASMTCSRLGNERRGDDIQVREAGAEDVSEPTRTARAATD